MSTPATTAFLNAWRTASPRRPVALCQIVLDGPVLYVATAECITPDGTSWEAGLECEPIRDEVEYLGAGPNPVTFGFKLAKREYAALGERLDIALSDYQFKNMPVTVYLWEQSLTSFSDALQVFSGIIDTVEAGVDGVQFSAMQDRAWNKPVPSLIIDKTNYPNASDGAQGVPVPIVYGDFSAMPLRTPHAGLGFEDEHEDSGGARAVVPLIVSDTGAGAAKVRLLAASHAISDLYGAADSTRILMAGADRFLAPIDTASGVAETLTPTSYADVDDDSFSIRYPIVPIDVRTGGGNNSATNPRRAFDLSDETSYATLDQGASATKLELYLPSPSNFGKITSVTAVCCFSGDAGNGNTIRMYPRDNAGNTGTSTTAVSTSATPALMTYTYPTSWYSQSWAFGVHDGTMTYGGTSGNTISICVDFSGGTTNKARVYWVALYATVKPTRNLLVPGVSEIRRPYISGRPTGPTFDSIQWRVMRQAVPDLYSLDGSFYALLKGYKDDGSGTYTGSAAALIQRPPDIIRHLIATYGSGSFETGSSTFGSFVLCRSKLRAGQPNDFKMAVHVGQQTSVQEVAQQVARQSLTTFWQDRFTSLWMMDAWKPGDRVDYSEPVSWYDVATFTAGEGSLVDVRNEMRVGYLFDYFKGKTLAEAFISQDASSQGWNLPTVRDQRLTVTAGVNDKLDWKSWVLTTPTTRVSTLTPGTYTGAALAIELRNALRVHIPAQCVYGFDVVLNENDSLDFTVSGTPYVGTLAAGSYNPDSFAIEAERALNAAGSGLTFTVTYDHTTNAFTVAGSSTFTMLPETGTNALKQGWAFMGTYYDQGGTSFTLGASYPGTILTMTRPNTGDGFSFMFATGTNTATNCAHLLGYNVVDVSPSSRGINSVATYSRGDRERDAVSRASLYGVTSKETIRAEWIRDEASAVSLRDRLWDMTSKPQIEATFSTFKMPDIRRFQTFEVSSDMDTYVAFPRYGSDGSWEGKVLRALSVTQYMGPTFQTEIRAVEA